MCTEHHWSSETEKLQRLFPWNAMEVFSFRPQDSSNNSPNFFFYLTYSTFQSVCRIQQGPSLMFFKWLTKSLIRYGVCANNLHKRIKSHLANIVESLQSSWTDGNRFAWLDCRSLDRARWFLLYWHLHFQNVILKLLELIHNMFTICLRAEVFILTTSLWGFV